MLPFTEEQFLAVFARFNATLTIPIDLLWIVTLAALTLSSRRPASRLLVAVLVLHWLWSGLVYHWGYFIDINPAARVFGFLFIVQAGLLAWLGLIRRRVEFAWGGTWSQRASAAFALYAMAYPALVMASGLRWPRMPAFGVPCPTTILTLGMLRSAEPRQTRGLAIIPLLWAAIGGSAALLLGVLPDYALIVAGLAVLIHILVPRRGGHL